MAAIDEVQPVETAWTTGTIIEKELPTPAMVRLRIHVEDRPPPAPGRLSGRGAEEHPPGSRAPGAGRGLYGATSVLLMTFCV